MSRPSHWDVFCRVVDNHGDLGVAWRLCVDLAERGIDLRLWVDDASALAWMAPQGHAGVEIVRWTDPATDLLPGDVVIETFGAAPPAAFARRMAARLPAPVWIDLEYLSAEPFVERSHGLPSPVKVGPGQLLTRHFFFPGFTAATGGLIREPGLLAAQRNFDPAVWLASHGVEPTDGERVASLFCYANPGLGAMLETLAAQPTLLLVTPGAPAEQARSVLDASLRLGALRAKLLPYLSQVDYDRLLWACDLNLVRGEDSFVRAQWAARPFVWQIYPQPDGVHEVKLRAFLDRFMAGSSPELSEPLARLWLGWNGFAPAPQALPEPGAWCEACEAWRDRLLGQADLSTRLIAFVEKML